jgi:hypothetical protein
MKNRGPKCPSTVLEFVASVMLLAFAPGLSSPAAAGEPSIGEVERRFRDLPMEARRWTGPLFWLHGDESKARLEEYVGKVAEGGNGCFTAESRPHSDWLGEGWFRDLRICLRAAKAHGLKMWIFDEKWWPSGEVGGKVPERYGSKRLSVEAASVAGPARFSAPGYGGPRIVAVLAGRAEGDAIDGASLVDLAGSVRDGVLAWDAPAGSWKVCKFTWAPQKVGGRYLVDGASRDAADWYIKTVYQPHYDRFKADFGKDILGFFFDEPETHGDWGTEVMAVLAERNADAKKCLVAWKLRLTGEEDAAARYQYADALVEAWGRTLYGGISRWCADRGVRSIGHFLEHGEGYLRPDLCAGNMFGLMKYNDMGGIDAVFDQFVWGKRVTRDAPIWQTPKLGSSITHAYGKPDDVTMVEIFGARGQDLTYPEMKWWTDHMHVSGVNFHIPHSFNPRAPRDTDCPPYFYNGGFEPRWPLYRTYADTTSRLSDVLSGGRHVCPVALLFVGTSGRAGRRIAPDGLSEALQDALYDCDWIPYEVFEGDMAIAGKDLKLRAESYRVLVVPPVEVIPHATMVKAREFFDAGGVVVGYGFLPSKSATLGRGSKDIALLREAIWGASPAPGTKACKVGPAGGRSYFLAEKPGVEDLRRVLAGDAGIRPTFDVVEGKTDGWLHVLHRVKAGRDVFFVTNGNHLSEARRFRFRIAAEGHPECWDPMRNEISTIPARRDGGAVEMDVTMEPNESFLVVFQEARRPLPARLEPGAPAPARSIPIARLPVPPPPAPVLEAGSWARRFEGCSWVWYPEGNPAASAPPGKRFFRKAVEVPAGRKIVRGRFLGTADNSFVLSVDGREAGRGDESPEGWRSPVEIDVTKAVHAGRNVLAIAAANATDKASPAGLVGRLVVEFEGGDPLSVPVDGSWKAAKAESAGWTAAAFDDTSWPKALEVAPFGAAPWGSLGGGITLSPAKADPFVGRVEVPADLNLGRSRIHLEVDDLKPEAAARVTINGKYAGGFIGRPFRLDVGRHLKPGENEIRIEPFAPAAARLAVRPLEERP